MKLLLKENITYNYKDASQEAAIYIIRNPVKEKK